VNRPSAPPALLEGPSRCQLAFTAPFALLAGGLYGAAAARLTRTPAEIGVPLGAIAFLFFAAIQIGSGPWAAERFGGKDGRWGSVASYLWDALMGAVLGLPLVSTVGEPTLAGIGAALTAGGVYGWLMGFVVCGQGAETLVRIVFEGAGGHPRPRHSYATALALQGRTRAAVEVYQEALSYDPKDVEAYLGLASIQHRFLHDSDGAILTLRTALRQATMTEGHTIVVFQRLAAIRGEQNRPEALAPDLARYLDKKGRGPAADWARANLTRIKGGAHDEGTRGTQARADRGAVSDA